MSIIERIIYLLNDKGLKRADLARHINKSTGQISMWEKRNTNPPAEILPKIANFFDVSVGFLLGEDEKEEVKSEFSIKKKLFIQKVEAMTDEQIDKLEQIVSLIEGCGDK